MLVQAFVAEPTVEALDEGILAQMASGRPRSWLRPTPPRRQSVLAGSLHGPGRRRVVGFAPTAARDAHHRMFHPTQTMEDKPDGSPVVRCHPGASPCRSPIDRLRKTRPAVDRKERS